MVDKPHRLLSRITEWIRALEELPHVRGQGQWPRVPGCDGAGTAEKSYPSPRSGAEAERSYPESEVRGGGWEELQHVPTPKTRGGSREELPHV